MQVAQNKVVAIDYKLTDADGTVLDTSEGNDPLAYLHGNGNLLPALEAELDGKASGDSVTAILSPEDGYGVRNEELRQEIALDEFGDAPDLEVGMQFRVAQGENQPIFTVIEINNDKVLVDGNHPLAGVELHFDVTVRDVRDATDDELEHGHAHGAGGHAHE
jgi:FKBP-type peptidyl-prolyl cis-trans isomerase SlyD